jgi:hypothetical protein
MILDPAPVKRQVLIKLPDPLNEQARELAALRRQPLGPLLTQILAKVVPLALREERERSPTVDVPESPAVLDLMAALRASLAQTDRPRREG